MPLREEMRTVRDLQDASWRNMVSDHPPLPCRRRRVLRVGDSTAPVSARLRCEHRGQPLQAHL